MKKKQDYCINTSKSYEGAGWHVAAQVGLQLLNLLFGNDLQTCLK